MSQNLWLDLDQDIAKNLAKDQFAQNLKNGSGISELVNR